MYEHDEASMDHIENPRSKISWNPEIISATTILIERIENYDKIYCKCGCKFVAILNWNG